MDKYTNKRTDKTDRQRALLQLIAAQAIGTQRELVRVLGQRGLVVTQASISRDVAELGLVKVGGRYQSAALGAPTAHADPELPFRLWVRQVASAGPNLVVIKGESGTAQHVALALDELAPAGVVGTIAGDDTVFAAVVNAAAGRRLIRFLEERMSGGGRA